MWAEKTVLNNDEWKLIIILTELPNTSDNYGIIAPESIQKEILAFEHVRAQKLFYFFFFKG